MCLTETLRFRRAGSHIRVRFASAALTSIPQGEADAKAPGEGTVHSALSSNEIQPT